MPSVTLLSVLGAHGIALPMSPAFPAQELQYVMDQSEASMLLSSAKFFKKAQDVEALGLVAKPRLVELQKKLGGGKADNVSLESAPDGKGGLMLYTSGTTNRPVSDPKLTCYHMLTCLRKES